MMPPGAIALIVVVEILLFIGSVLAVFCCPEPEQEDNVDPRGAQTRAHPAPAPVEQRAAAAAAPVVKLRYFPYSAKDGTTSERLDCAICLEPFLHGELCGEVPACRHLFHRECINLWLKSENSCPLCRADIVTGSERVSVADRMV